MTIVLASVTSIYICPTKSILIDSSIFNGEESHGAQECAQELEKENKATFILTFEMRTVRLKTANQTNISLLLFLARANFFHLANMENLSEWTEKDFDKLICSAHLCHIAPTLAITLRCYFCANL